MEIKDSFEFIQEVNKLEFRYAKTYGATNPHEYRYSNGHDETEVIQALNKYIQEHGEKEMFYTTEFDVLYVDGHKYWSMDYWNRTKIINRNWDFKNEDGTINKSITESKKTGE